MTYKHTEPVTSKALSDCMQRSGWTLIDTKEEDGVKTYFLGI